MQTQRIDCLISALAPYYLLPIPYSLLPFAYSLLPFYLFLPKIFIAFMHYQWYNENEGMKFTKRFIFDRTRKGG